MRNRMKAYACVAVGGAVLAGLAACSSSASSSSPSGGSPTSAISSASAVSSASSGGSTAAKATAAKAAAAIASLDPQNGTNKIEPQTPLAHAPAKGKTLWWLEGNIPVQELFTPAFQAATKALGWNLHVLSYNFTDPQAAIAAMQQAVAAKPDYIAVSGQTISTLGQGIAAAKSAGIPVFELAGGTDVPGGKTNDVYSNIDGPVLEQDATKDAADWVIADSGGTANVLWVNVPSNPILHVAEEAETAAFAQCSSCSLTRFATSFSDMSNGTVPSEIVSQLQSHPSINYVQVAYGDIADGLPAALKAAGLASKVKIVGAAGTGENLTSLAAGTSAAYAEYGQPDGVYESVDAMVRVSENMPVDPIQHDLTYVTIWTPKDVPNPVANFAGPKDYAEQYYKLWDVG
jgi:ribose transport system substrate-binding protein